MSARATAALAAIEIAASRSASRFESHGSGGGYRPIAGRLSSRMVTRGASSAARSRTTNSSPPLADESRADANQSIVETGSPGSYGREPITSVPWPRRRLGKSPNGRPLRRRLGTSGNVRRSRADMRSPVPVRRRRRRELQTARADPAKRLLAAERAGLGEKRRGEQQAVPEHRQEEQLDVLGHDVRAPVQ